MVDNIRRGDIVYIDLGYQEGSVQSGKRPCLVVSNDKSNRASEIVNVIPLSSKRKNNPVHVTIRPKDVRGHLERVSDALVEQVATKSKEEILQKVAHVPKASPVMKAVTEAMILQMELE